MFLSLSLKLQRTLEKYVSATVWDGTWLTGRQVPSCTTSCTTEKGAYPACPCGDWVDTWNHNDTQNVLGGGQVTYRGLSVLRKVEGAQEGSTEQ